MSTFSKIFWWFMLISSTVIIVYEAITTGVADHYHLLVSLISLAVIDLSKQQEVCNGL